MFVAFFAVIIAVNAVFAYYAIHTNTGEVDKHSYEDGLAFNKTLAEARSQPRIVETASFDGGVLRWQLHETDGTPIENATVSARIIRPVAEGNDFMVDLVSAGGGVYTARLTLPQQGLWEAKLDGRWKNNKEYRKSFRFVAQ